MMAKRMILMLAVVITLLAGLGFVKYRQIQAAVAPNGNFQPPPEPVTTIVAQRENWPSTLNIIGCAEDGTGAVCWNPSYPPDQLGAVSGGRRRHSSSGGDKPDLCDLRSAAGSPRPVTWRPNSAGHDRRLGWRRIHCPRARR